MFYVDFVIISLIFLSVISFAIAVIGVIRFPDFYTRVHSASKGDTLSTMLMLSAVIIFLLKTDFSQTGYLTVIKICLVIFFMFLTGPTGIHTLINAGYELGKKPFIKNDKKEAEKND